MQNPVALALLHHFVGQGLEAFGGFLVQTAVKIRLPHIHAQYGSSIDAGGQIAAVIL